MNFSEKYGYKKPSDVIIRERITPEIQHAVGNCYLDLLDMLYLTIYRQLEQYIQRYCLNLSIENVPSLSLIDENPFSIQNDYKHFIILPFLKQENNEWWKKIDIIEATIVLFKGPLKDYVATHEEKLPSMNDPSPHVRKLAQAYTIIANEKRRSMAGLQSKMMSKE